MLDQPQPAEIRAQISRIIDLAIERAIDQHADEENPDLASPISGDDAYDALLHLAVDDILALFGLPADPYHDAYQADWDAWHSAVTALRDSY